MAELLARARGSLIAIALRHRRGAQRDRRRNPQIPRRHRLPVAAAHEAGRSSPAGSPILIGVPFGLWLSRRAHAAGRGVDHAGPEHRHHHPDARHPGARDERAGHRRAPGHLRAVGRLAAADRAQHLRRAARRARALLEAATGMGMQPRQILQGVEIPERPSVILAGIRTALAINVGTAPLAFLIGGGGLGELIFSGIDLNEPGMMLAGAIPTACLPSSSTSLSGALTCWVVPRGVNPNCAERTSLAGRNREDADDRTQTFRTRDRRRPCGPRGRHFRAGPADRRRRQELTEHC